MRAACAARFGLGLVMAIAGCALPPWIGHRPAFPTGGSTTWRIPLYRPLTEVGPHVIAAVCGASAGGARRCEDALLYVDSGSSHSALPAATFARLGVETTRSRFATIENAAGETRGWSGGILPEIRFGDVLSLGDVVTVVYDATPILGLDVLAEHGWQIDLDRGTLTLGAQLAAEGAPPAARLPIRGFPQRTIVDLAVQGRGVPLLLDTGAPFTVVDVSWLKAVGLPLRSLHYGWPLSERDRNLRIGEATDADVRLGGLDFGRRPLVGHPRATDGPTRGMLGLDLLSDYAFGVAAGSLDLVRRAPSPLTDASARIARWPDLPTCPDLSGCVAAKLEPTDDVQVRVRVAASAPGAHRYLFGCVDGQGRLRDFPIWIEIGLRAPTAGQERVVVVEMPERLRPLWKTGCEGLALLDVNPVLSDILPMASDAEARLAISSRRIRLD